MFGIRYGVTHSLDFKPSLVAMAFDNFFSGSDVVAKNELKEKTQASYGVDGVYGPGHPLYYANVIDTLRGDANAAVDGYEGLRSLEVLIAAYRSARDGVRVGLPLVF